MADYRDLLEPEAAGEAPHPETGDVEPAMLVGTLLSIAVSLRRLADAVHGDPKNSGIRDAIIALADRQ